MLHLNERVAWLGNWKHGFFSMTAVAALNVGDIVEEGMDDIQTNKAWGRRQDCTFIHTCSQVGKKSLYFSELVYDDPKVCAKGSAFGHFNFGSTIVLLFEIPKSEAKNQDALPFEAGDRVKVGQALVKSNLLYIQ